MCRTCLFPTPNLTLRSARHPPIRWVRSNVRRSLALSMTEAIQYRDSRDFAIESVVALYRANEWSSAEKPDLLHRALLGSHSLFTAWHGERLRRPRQRHFRRPPCRLLPASSRSPRLSGARCRHRTDAPPYGSLRGLSSAHAHRRWTRSRLLPEARLRARRTD